MAAAERVFLLSPANCNGERGRMVLRPEATFELARELRSPAGVPLGAVFSFMSGLYFRGKLAYARAFVRPSAADGGILVITPSGGLRSPDEPIGLATLLEFAVVDVDPTDARYRLPLLDDARRLADAIDRESEVVLLGSVATGKYLDVLRDVLGDRLRFPVDFVGRGDMSRGGLLLRCVHEGRELAYAPIPTGVRRGARPPRLDPRSRPPRRV